MSLRLLCLFVAHFIAPESSPSFRSFVVRPPSAPVDSLLPNRWAFCIIPPEPGVLFSAPQVMRLRKFNLGLLAATLTVCPLWNGLTEEPRFPHKSWDVHDGLPDNRIKTIFQTRDGYLWLGTRDGALALGAAWRQILSTVRWTADQRAFGWQQARA